MPARRAGVLADPAMAEGSPALRTRDRLRAHPRREQFLRASIAERGGRGARRRAGSTALGAGGGGGGTGRRRSRPHRGPRACRGESPALRTDRETSRARGLECDVAGGAEALQPGRGQDRCGGDAGASEFGPRGGRLAGSRRRDRKRASPPDGPATGVIGERGPGAPEFVGQEPLGLAFPPGERRRESRHARRAERLNGRSKAVEILLGRSEEGGHQVEARARRKRTYRRSGIQREGTGGAPPGLLDGATKSRFHRCQRPNTRNPRPSI
jgi:hypothetical protein